MNGVLCCFSGSTLQQLRLRTLLLRGNLLQKLSRGEVSPSLEVLDLSHNQISHISPFTFTAVNLRTVNLSYNELTSIASNSLEISYSQVRFLWPGTFLMAKYVSYGQVRFLYTNSFLQPGMFLV
jgi:hypothetical protein